MERVHKISDSLLIIIKSLPVKSFCNLYSKYPKIPPRAGLGSSDYCEIMWNFVKLNEIFFYCRHDDFISFLGSTSWQIWAKANPNMDFSLFILFWPFNGLFTKFWMGFIFKISSWFFYRWCSTSKYQKIDWSATSRLVYATQRDKSLHMALKKYFNIKTEQARGDIAGLRTSKKGY